MKRIVRVAGMGATAAAVLVSGHALAGPGAVQQVTFEDSFFDPAKPPPFTVSQGVREVAWLGPDTDLPHNIHQDKRLFRSGPPSTSVDEYQTNIAAGRYHYYCQVHGSKSGGMDGVLRIGPSFAATGTDDSVGIRWADSEAEPKHRYRVEYRRVGGNRWKVWKKGTAQTEDIFGADNDPVNANPSREYQVRVRTFVKGKKQRRSGWSPRPIFQVGT